MRITIVGLGPGAPGHLTQAAQACLEAAHTLYLRTQVHPTVAALPQHLELRSFDELYDRADSFEAIYATIANELVEGARAEGEIVYAVPGDPMMAEATTRHIKKLARARDVAVRIIPGVSFIEPVCAALDLDPLEHGLQLIDALDFALPHDGDTALDAESWASLHGHTYTPPLTPFPVLATRPTLICQVYNQRVAADVKLSLLERFPPEHPITIIQAAGIAEQEQVWSLPLVELDRHQQVDHLTCVFVPPLAPLADTRSPDGLGYIVMRLLGPNGCPWDREQTPQSQRAGLLGETYEVLEALDDDDPDALAEELGDLLMNILSQAEMARQAGIFGIEDVYASITTKLIRRHPHVFGDLSVNGSSEVLRNWDKIKQAERAAKGQKTRGTLDGVPRDLPALAQSQEQAGKAAKVGFEWAQSEDVWAKLHEEIAEVQDAARANIPDRNERLTHEIGDLLLATAVLARHLGVDAESALRTANLRFRRRFERVEQLAAEEGNSLRDLTIDMMLALWSQAKRDLDGR